MVNKWIHINFWLVVFSLCNCNFKPDITAHKNEKTAKNVLNRSIGESAAANFTFKYIDSDANDFYKIEILNNHAVVIGNSPVALCRGAYDYLRNHTNSIVSWSGKRIDIPVNLPIVTKEIHSPFKYRYYFNTVTHGYTTPYWDWARWEKELDWMALHGMNMPLIAGAHEAILLKVFQQLGLTQEEALDYFSGPAHFPWNRMGNVGSWDGPPPISFFTKQIELTHQMLNRMGELGMSPIVHAFAGFVPQGIKRLYPNEELRELGWGGFSEKVNILAPSSELYHKIGSAYIKEWEKEFGKGQFYLADSFNEMDVPLSEDSLRAAEELASYGEVVYQPIVEANPNAVWVMQGWTFPYHRDKNGDLFWTSDRLKSMMSRIPDDKLLILDMANEYNALFWKIDYSWEMYEGFFGKQWIYSFIPNMGGKTPLNGVLEFYAKAPIEAYNYQKKRNLVGFGFAPEGIENNELIYELLSDWGWRDQVIDLDTWVQEYCMSRYGAYPDNLSKAFDLLRQSAWGTFTDHPRFNFQFRPGKGNPTVHQSPEFDEAVQAFLSCASELGDEKLYLSDAIELTAQYLGLKIDEILANAEKTKNGTEKHNLIQEAIDLMLVLDRLLASHPNHKLSNWVNLARNYGNNQQERLYYESNAKRLNTTWGGWVNDYAARIWSGLIGDYYAKRWQLWLNAQKSGDHFDILKWEESWITKKWENNSVPFPDPLAKAVELVNSFN